MIAPTSRPVIAITAAILALTSICGAQPYPSSDYVRPMALRSLELGRKFDESTAGKVNPSPRVPKPRIITKAEWGASPTTAPMQSQFPNRLTFHHEGTAKALKGTEDVPKLLRDLQKWGAEAKGWPDIPYHFMVDLNGNIYEARDALKRGDTNTTYSTAGHLLVCAMGNYELQVATEKELSAIADLMAWLSDYYNIDPATLRGHMEYASTQCPGKYLYPYVASGFLEGEIRKRIRKAYLGTE